MKYLSHLEFMKTITRALERYNVPIKYSEGFSPNPLINIALPLAVGVEALRCYLEVQIEDEYPLEELLSINTLPKGISFLDVKEVDLAKGLMSKVYFAEYEILGDILDFEEKLNEEQLFYKRLDKKKRVIPVDAKSLIDSYTITPDSLSIIVNAGASGNLRPQDLLKAMGHEEAVFDHKILLHDLYTREKVSLWQVS